MTTTPQKRRPSTGMPSPMARRGNGGASSAVGRGAPSAPTPSGAGLANEGDQYAPLPAVGVAGELPEDERIDVAEIADLVDGRWAELRRSARASMGDEALHRIEGLTKDEHRERVLTQLALLRDTGIAHRGFPTYVGGEDRPGGYLAAFEEVLVGDPSLQIKAGVQFGLFASAIHQLGNREHHDK
nr:hypothetical protein [Actinomycetales bacterium]